LERLVALELSLLEGTAGLERLEELLDDPACLVGGHDALHVIDRIDAFRRGEQPLHRFLAFWWIQFGDHDEVQRQILGYGRVRLVELPRLLQPDTLRGEGDSRRPSGPGLHGAPSRRLALASRELDIDFEQSLELSCRL